MPVLQLQQRRIFIFGGPRLFLIGSPSGRYDIQLALHVLVTFTEQVVPIRKHITLFFILNSLDIKNNKTVTITQMKRQR